MTAPTTTRTGASTPALPHAASVRELQRLLDARTSRHQGPGPVTAPRAGALGVADLLARDPAGIAAYSAASTAAGERQQAVNVHLTAHAVLIGPWGGDPDLPSGCGLCLGMRWQRLRPRLEQAALYGGGQARPVGSWPLLTGHLVDAVWGCYQAAFLDPRPRPDAGALPQVTRIDLATLTVRTVPLLPEPNCPGCARTRPAADAPAPLAAAAAPPATAPAPPELRPRPKSAPDAYRSRRPQEYLLPADALVNEVCGALGPAAYQLLDSPTTAPVSGSGTHRAYTGLMELTWSGQADSFGLSRELAFLEGLERWSGSSRRGEPTFRVLDSLDNLGEAALDPRTCGEYAPRTYREDPLLEPFAPDRTIPWVRGYSLRDHRTVLVPERLVYYGSGTAADNFVFECSNGCASGGSLEEAVLFALLELIERDAFLLGWYGGADLTEIDLGGVADLRLRTMVDRAGLQGYDVHVFDNRIDLAVPVATAVAARRDGGPGTLVFAAGASPHPESAILGALSEILTYLPVIPRQVHTRRDELTAMAENFDLVRTLPDHSGLFALPEMAVHARRYLEAGRRLPADQVYADWNRRRPRNLDLLDDIRFCRDDLARAGHDVIIVDQTSAEQLRLGLRTVCAIVPGLLPIDFGWSRQRALHMPRTFSALHRAGLRDRELGPDDLHLVPHPFP
ncbi:TOMM precursor leader peptide-binding protein [Streptacidiphilus sp. PAMC 29251]